MAERPLHRSYLFAPGTDEHKMKKASQARADAIVFDLEDSVSPADKAFARELVGRLVGEVAEKVACEIHVRVNRFGDRGYDQADITRVVVPGLAALRLPKCESADDVAAVSTTLDQLEATLDIAAGTVCLYPTIETASGVLLCTDIARASPRVAALVFGAADFGASIGVLAPSFESTLLARSTLVLASAAAGIGRPVDGAFLNFEDLDELEAHCRRVRALGFGGKSAIHPTQVPVIQDVFTPSDDEVDRARRIVASVEGTTGVLDRSFVDPPVVAQARAVLELKRRVESKGE